MFVRLFLRVCHPVGVDLCSHYNKKRTISRFTGSGTSKIPTLGAEISDGHLLVLVLHVVVTATVKIC